MNTAVNPETLANLGLDLGLEANLGLEEMLEGTTPSTRLTLGTPAQFMIEVGDTPLLATATLKGGTLTSISALSRVGRLSGLAYTQVRGSCAGVDIDLSVEIDGQQVSLERLLWSIYNASHPCEFGVFRATMARQRLGGTMPLFFSHNGANAEYIEGLGEAFLAKGATTKVNGSLQTWNLGSMIGGAPKLMSIEMGSQDRSMSIHNQGFVDLVNAQIEHFSNLVAVRAARKATTEGTDAYETASKRAESISRAASWGGSQIGKTSNPDGTSSEGDRYYAVDIPVGKMTVSSMGEEFDMNFWHRRPTVNTEDQVAQAAQVVINQDEDDANAPF